jgi:predicted O-methyltransferase YrrM
LSKFDEITEKFSDVKYMNKARAEVLRELIDTHDARDILEIGFFKGKSSAYIAACLEDLGRGSLVTIDRERAREYSPNIHELLSQTGLAHRVEPIFAFRSFTWELQKLIARTPRPQFDLCYFDGGHTWDETGFGFLLVDLLLRPGGVIVFDDMHWTIAGSTTSQANAAKMRRFSPDEAEARNVERVWDLLVPERGYEKLEVLAKFSWGVARKPARAAGAG